MNKSCTFPFWFALLLCSTQIRLGACGGGQLDEPTDDDYGEYVDYSNESAEGLANSTEVSMPSSEPPSDTNLLADSDVGITTASPAVPVTVPEPTAATAPAPTATPAIAGTVASSAPSATTLCTAKDRSFTCPDNCRCSDMFQYVDCSHQQLSDLPNHLPNTTKRLDLSFNQFTSFNLSSLTNYICLRELILSNNQIEVVHDTEAAARLPTLETINLAANTLRPLNGQEFQRFRKLTHLTLANNTNVVDASTAFTSHSLHTLNLFNCNIARLPDRIFQNLTNLKSLDLQQNPLDLESSMNAFEPLKRVRTLKMPTLDRPVLKRLCDALSSIDMINLEKGDLSCLVLESGLSYDDSFFITGRTTPKPYIEEEYIATHPPHIVTLAPPITSTTAAPVPILNRTNLVPNISNVQTSKQQTNQLPQVEVPSGNKTTDQSNDPNRDDTETSRVDISDGVVRILLIALICATVLAIMVGVLCRADCCGIKTKCCRRSANRATSDDRTEPREEIPLNKI